MNIHNVVDDAYTFWSNVCSRELILPEELLIASLKGHQARFPIVICVGCIVNPIVRGKEPLSQRSRPVVGIELDLPPSAGIKSVDVWIADNHQAIVNDQPIGYDIQPFSEGAMPVHLPVPGI